VQEIGKFPQEFAISVQEIVVCVQDFGKWSVQKLLLQNRPSGLKAEPIF